MKRNFGAIKRAYDIQPQLYNIHLFKTYKFIVAKLKYKKTI